MRRPLATGFAALLFLALAAPSLSQAGAGEELQRQLRDLWGDELGAAPATPGLLLLEMAKDAARAERILTRAGAPHRSVSDTLLSTLELSEAQAVRMLPELHVVRDDSPAPELRPPSWPQLRWQGVELLERIALDPSDGRDLRLLRALAERRAQTPRWTPSEIAGLVVLCSEWWVDRGDAAAFYLSADRRPSVDAWLDSLSTATTLWDLLGPLHDDPLRRRLLLARLSPSEHAFLSGECMEILGSYAADFEARGFAPRRWDAELGRMAGYDEVDLREIALAVLPRVSPIIPSGLNEHEQIRDAFAWWRKARYQARYYRDANASAPPVLPRVLWDLRAPVEGGLPMHEWIKELYSHDELRELVLDEMGPQHAPLVAELVQWLGYSQEQARDAGFNFAERRFPLRPDPSSRGLMYVVPWEGVQLLIRELLAAITGYELVANEELNAQTANSQWQAWWNGARADARWYRDPTQAETPELRFAPQRGRADD